MTDQMKSKIEKTGLLLYKCQVKAGKILKAFQNFKGNFR